MNILLSFFLSPARRSCGGGLWRRLGCPYLRLSASRFRSRSRKPIWGISFILRTHIPYTALTHVLTSPYASPIETHV